MTPGHGGAPPAGKRAVSAAAQDGGVFTSPISAPAAPPPPAPPTPDAWAQVAMRDQVTRYHRRGAGRPVLLLGGAEYWPALDDALAARCRTLSPDLPDAPALGPTELAAWLREFLDSLGVEGAAVVAAEAHGAAAVAFADADPERVERLLLLYEPPEAPAPAAHGPSPAVATTTAGPMPVCVVVGREGAALEAAVTFLDARGPGTIYP